VEIISVFTVTRETTVMHWRLVHQGAYTDVLYRRGGGKNSKPYGQRHVCHCNYVYLTLVQRL
jgi:hypothetical protein